MKKFVLTVAVVLGAMIGEAQQDPQYSQFMYDRMSINPGYAGVKGTYCGTMLYRNQWMGFQGSPKTVLINAEGPVPILRGGLGLTYFNDRLGVEENNLVRLNYSYHQGVPGPGMLGIGIGLGYMGKRFNPNWDPIDITDTEIPGLNGTGNPKGGVFDMALGVYYHHPDYYVGLSATHLSGGSVPSLNLKAAQHYFVQAGYHYRGFGKPWLVTPHVRVESDAASTQLDLNVTVLYDDMIWGGVSYRMGDAVAAMVGYQMQLTPTPDSPKGTAYQWLRAGVAYDVTTSPLRNYSSGTLELFIQYCFKPNPDQPVIRPLDVRFLGT